MFGNNMMGKLQEMQLKMEETKKRLDTITVTGEAGDGAVKIVVTGNRVINDVEISDELMNSDKEELQDLLIIAMNRAMEKAENINEAEMKGVAAGMMPGMPGM
jgi:DNA-binding YbaB/EbfC family protein